jgi:hypothetical protein
VNCTPLSDVRCVGTWQAEPAIKREMRAVEKSPVDIILRGMAYTQLVQQSTILKRYWEPSGAVGRGPISTCMWVNLLVGTGIGKTGAVGWRVTLAVRRCTQSLHHWVTSEARLGHR